MANLTCSFNPEENQWIVKDGTTVDDYYTNNFETCWDADEYTCVYFKFNRNSDGLKIMQLTSDDDCKRCRLAYNRHLKAILEQTGVVEKKEKPTVEMVILDTSHQHRGLAKIQQVTARLTEKKLNTTNHYGMSYNKYDIAYAPATPDRLELVKEYNEAISTFMEALGEMRVEIFGTRCSHCNEYSRNHEYLIPKGESYSPPLRYTVDRDKHICSHYCYQEYCKDRKIAASPKHKIGG